jgi:hypothetical protein
LQLNHLQISHSTSRLPLSPHPSHTPTLYLTPS